MSIFYTVLAIVVAQRGGELVLTHVNTTRLRALGAVEIDRAGYKWFVMLHAGWLVGLAATVPAATAPSWPLLTLYGLLQVGRLWVIASLGRRWTTRLIVLPGAPTVTTGPYRYLRHPNYLIVAGELAILPLAFGIPMVAAVATACNAMLIAHRIRLENTALGLRPTQLPSYHISETLPHRR
jgi:methyltransferase